MYYYYSLNSFAIFDTFISVSGKNYQKIIKWYVFTLHKTANCISKISRKHAFGH